MDVFIRGIIVSLGVIYWEVLLASSQRKVAEICLIALLYSFFACKISRTIERFVMKFYRGVLLKFVDKCQFLVKSGNKILFT